MKSLDYSIIIVGKISSGKTTLAKLVSQSTNIPIASFADAISQICIEKGLMPTRELMQELGNELAKHDFRSFLDKVITTVIGSKKKIIFEGVRHENIFNEIKEISSHCISIYLDISFEERFRRYTNRENIFVSIEEFNRIDSHPVENEIQLLKGSCDIVLNGNYNYHNLSKHFTI